MFQGRVRFALLSLAVLMSLGGCDSSPPLLDYEYVAIQREDGFAMKGPITIHVRFEWKGDVLMWRERAIDSNGQTFIGVYEYKSCQVFDDRNFRCTLSDEWNKLSVQMKDGDLSSDVYGSIRNYKRQPMIFGYSL